MPNRIAHGTVASIPVTTAMTVDISRLRPASSPLSSSPSRRNRKTAWKSSPPNPMPVSTQT